MRPMPLLLALGMLTGPLAAQANCSAGSSPAQSLLTRNPFSRINVYRDPSTWGTMGPLPSMYTGFTFLFDLTLSGPIDLTQIDIALYDDGGGVSGAGTPITSPNQVGNTTNVELWIFPGFSWMGNETSATWNGTAWVPTGGWGQLGAGTLTVAPSTQHSVATFPSPISIPPGLHGFAFKVDMTTSGMNAGPLHPLVDGRMNMTPAPTSFTAPAMTMTNLRFDRQSWIGALTPASHWQNLELHYSIQSGYADWTSFGSGCVPPNDPVLTLQDRPVIGNTVTMQTANIQAGTSLNFWFFGFTPDPNGFGLGGFGLPGCNLYLQQGSTIISNVTGVNSGISTVPLVIPNMASLAGLVVYSQAAPATPGVNAAGFLASNAVCIATGPF